MNIPFLVMLFGLLAIPWTLAGIIYPPAAGMGRASRRRVFLYGCAALGGTMALSYLLLYGASFPAKASSDALETAMAALLLLACAVWPPLALVLKAKAKAEAARAARAKKP